MIFRVWLAFFFPLVFVPFGVGTFFLREQGRSLRYICGLAASLFYFEIIMLIFHVTGASFRIMVLLWCESCGLIAIFGFFSQRKRPQSAVREKISLDKVEKILLVSVILTVTVVTLNTVLNTTYVNWDDQTYCANAVSTWENDVVNRFTPFSGGWRMPFYDKKYNIAGWPIYSSMLAVLSGIHPAIVYRTILPLFEIPASFGVVYMLLREFFPKNLKNVLLGVLYYTFFALAVSEKMGGNCSEWWLFVNCWTGKALSFNILVPLVFWLMFRLEKEQDARARTAYWITLFLVGGASCNIAATMFVIFPIEVGAWGIFYLYRTKRWKDIFKFALCASCPIACALWTMV